MASPKQSALEVALAVLNRPVPAKTDEQHARDFIRMAARQISALRDQRLFAKRCFGYWSLTAQNKRHEALAFRLAQTYRRRAAELLAAQAPAAARKVA